MKKTEKIAQLLIPIVICACYGVQTPSLQMISLYDEESTQYTETITLLNKKEVGRHTIIETLDKRRTSVQDTVNQSQTTVINKIAITKKPVYLRKKEPWYTCCLSYFFCLTKCRCNCCKKSNYLEKEQLPTRESLKEEMEKTNTGMQIRRIRAVMDKVGFGIGQNI